MTIASRLASAGIVLLVLAAASGGAVLADAEPRPDRVPAPHLLYVPDTAEAIAALDRTDARVVARYESFALVEAAGADDQLLRAAGADRRDDMRRVTTASGAVDPAADRTSLASKDAPARDEVLALVQFVGPPKDTWVERLRATGARMIGYSAQNAYVVHAQGEAIDRVAALVGGERFVRAVTPVRAADKIERGAASGPVTVQTVAGAAGADARARAAALGAELSEPSRVAGVESQGLRLTADEVAELARDPGVVLVEPRGTPQLFDERNSQIAAGNLSGVVPTGPGYLAWLTSKGFPATTFDFTIDITDEGIDNGSVAAPDHPDFYVNGVPGGGSRLTYANDHTGPGPARDCGGHGTNVASIAAGLNSGAGAANEDSAGFNYGLGVAPRARIGASRIFDCTGDGTLTGTLTDVVEEASQDGAVISNNSWGLTGLTPGATFALMGTYTTESREYDLRVRDAQPSVPGAQEMVIVFSAGNTGDSGAGSVMPPGTAKNVITVGAAESVRSIGGTDGCGVTDAGADRAFDVIDFSSRGPTNDQRLKPDLVAPGTHVVGARPRHGFYNFSGTCNGIFPAGTFYNLVSGTSQAAPVVTGAAALIRDWYRRGPGGGTATPSPAMTKAILTNSAADMAGGADGKGGTLPAAPGEDVGWGRVNLGGIFDEPARDFVDQSDVLGGTGQASVRRAYAVPDPNRPVRVTLAWTDAVPASSGGNAFVNDLDLEVSTGTGTYLGNVLAGGVSQLGGDRDTRDNLESVVLPAGVADRISVRVVGTTIGGDGVPGNADASDQDYALVVSNAVADAAPVLVHEATAADDPAPGGDADGELESGEQFEFDEELRNEGTATATGAQATLSAAPGSGLAVTQASSTYADMGESATATNDTPFGAQLLGSASCGANATATLSIETTGAVTQDVPVVLETGAEGASQLNTTAQLAAIPDDNSAGVTSSVVVAERGRIKDVDVRLDISHTWVGDLVIDLIAPDGTTVRLADHVGGPDNEGRLDDIGDGFIGTEFDDDVIQSISAGSAPYTGTFRPQNDQLSRLDGKSRQGTWRLRVRDLFDGDVGTLQGWGLTSQKALCNFDTAPPNTSIATGPGNRSGSSSATFTLAASEAGATFECQLDGGAFQPCGATVTYGGLAVGAHSFRARAIDGSDNEDATPATFAWTITAPPPPPPPPPPPTPATSFVLAPAEERLADALEGRYQVLTACAMPCRTSARLTVSARTARKLGLGRRSVTLGGGSASRRLPGTVVTKLRLTRKSRAALRGRAGVKATVRVTTVVDTATLRVSRSVQLLRAGGVRRVAKRGLRLWAVCARACPLNGEVTVSAREARRIGLRPGSASRMRVASGRVTGGRTPRLLKLNVPRSARGALGKARQLSVRLEAVAGRTPNPTRSARLNKTLRR